MNTTKSNPHAWFFNYVTGLEGYNKDFSKTIREGIILEFTNGSTGSLSELYASNPAMYRTMKITLLQEKANELDKARKRLIAVLFSFIKKENEKPSIQYVKTIACNASNVANFNDIPLNQLKSLYRIFGTKNTKGLTELERKLVWSSMRKEHQN